MYIVQNYSIAIVFCIITMLCWGSWANTQKLAAKDWRFELFYWDYVFGIFIFSLVLAFTLGSIGENGRSFAKDISQGNLITIISPIIGGVIFNLANILLVAAINILGMAVAFPVGIGIALVLGVGLNYILAPSGNFLLLIIGVFFIALAILIDGIAYGKAQKGKVISKNGIGIAVISGILMGVFYRFVAGSIATNFAMPEAGKLTPYTAFFLLAVGILCSNFLFNFILMKKPLSGTALSFKDYFAGSPRSHLAGLFGGLIWGIGTAFNILASGEAGFAVSYGLGQGATLVAAVWGVFIWKEFNASPRIVFILLYLMFLLYISGIGAIIISKIYL